MYERNEKKTPSSRRGRLTESIEERRKLMCGQRLFSVASSRISISSICALCAFFPILLSIIYIFFLQVSRWILSYFCAHRIILLLLSLSLPCHLAISNHCHFGSYISFLQVCFLRIFLAYEKISLYIYCVFV